VTIVIMHFDGRSGGKEKPQSLPRFKKTGRGTEKGGSNEKIWRIYEGYGVWGRKGGGKNRGNRKENGLEVGWEKNTAKSDNKKSQIAKGVVKEKTGGVDLKGKKDPATVVM